MEVFMNDFSVYGINFDECLANLSKVLQRCEESNLVLNWEKCHFMVRESIVLCHLVSERGIKVDKAKIGIIEKVALPSSVKEVRSFLRHAGFYRKFIKDFSKIAKPLTNLLNQDVPFDFDDNCLIAFHRIKEALISAPIMQPLDWELPFEIICDTSDYAANYATTEKEFLAVVFAVDKFRSYLVGSKVITYTDHVAIWLKQEEFGESFDNLPIDDSFPDENLFAISQLPWYADIVNYLVCKNKWVEAIAIPTNDARVVVKFFKKNIFTRCGTLRAIISDGGSHFCNQQFETLLKKYGVTNKLAIPYHPQTSGQVKVSNRELKRILEKIVNRSKKDWSFKLDDALWAYRTAFKTPIRITPFRLVYGKSCHLPIELEQAHWAIQTLNFNLKVVIEKRLLQVDELEEIKQDAYENAKIFKDRTKSWHDNHITKKEINKGDFVLLFNSRLKLYQES
ncbi:uncharacterized protein LOC131175263 [Hevea brasiliensis]|uniref:uncharacterized protein LOC131175263 n=1 Tax=Hevea brasiliensis TaxID=3981 RepID=UPI0025D5DB53|nr:uncharacterized protein LOC131175263 [Hevea brasiliensis]